MSVTSNADLPTAAADLHLLALDVQSGQEAAVHRDLLNFARLVDVLCSLQVEALILVESDVDALFPKLVEVLHHDWSCQATCSCRATCRATGVVVVLSPQVVEQFAVFVLAVGQDRDAVKPLLPSLIC